MTLRRLIPLLGTLFLFSCSPVHILNSTISRDGYTVKEDVAYGKDVRQKLDIYLPHHVTRSTPVVVFFYGGSWNSGEKKDYLFVAQGLVAQGYIVAIPDYRFYPGVQYPVFIQDCAKATNWVYQHIADYGGNPENLYLMGHSAGAYNAVMLALDEHYLAQAGGNVGWIRGVIGLAGPYDFLPMTDPDVSIIFAGEKDQPKTQPIHYVRPHAPPMLLIVGLDDDRVNPGNSQRLRDALLKQHDDVTYKEYPNVGHKGLILGVTDTLVSKAFLKNDIVEFIGSH